MGWISGVKKGRKVGGGKGDTDRSFSAKEDPPRDEHEITQIVDWSRYKIRVSRSMSSRTLTTANRTLSPKLNRYSFPRF